MKTIMTLLCFFALNTFAQYTPRVDLGLGLQNVGDYVDVLIKSEGYLHRGTGYYVVTFKAEGAAGNSGISSISLETSLLKIQIEEINSNGYFYAGLSLLDYQFNRNIDIDQRGTHTLTAIGMRAGGGLVLDKQNNIKLFAKAALSLGGLLKQSTRLSDTAKFSNTGRRRASTYSAELGATFKKLSVSTGVRGQLLKGKGTSFYSYTECYPVYDSYWDEYYTECDDVYDTEFDEFNEFREFFVKLSYDITNKFSVFAKYMKRSYEVIDYSQPQEFDSFNSANYFQVGVKYKFGGKKKRKKPPVQF